MVVGGRCSSIPTVIDDIRKGRMVVVTDDADRENEGDLIMAAEKVSPTAVNFMTQFGRGLICVPILPSRARQLKLPRMVENNHEAHQTDFTVSVDASHGITTGISVQDRAKTIRILASSHSKCNSLVQPGHIFPLQAKEGGVLQRAGHTEAAIDLARLAGLDPSGVLCEILNEDGSLARLPDLLQFCKKHELKLCTIRDLIAFRRKSEKLIERCETVSLPTDYGEFQLYLYRSKVDNKHHLALVRGTLVSSEPTLVRVHSECLTGDVFASKRCDCGGQLHAALKRIALEERGVLVYMRQEGRGIGLASKILAYRLQENGLDTVEANEHLGLPMDSREYGLGAQMLSDLGVNKIRLLTNNPRKVVGLQGYNLKIVEQIPLKISPNPYNAKYMATKKTKMGHCL
ncbi:Riboflavin biosynthesis protein RibBA [Candidatus Xiphinematobacter sp. Idaho Grape]|nr:Riboflavin biosynthesis protein RibBA [Candidatus Xiphinematobacter sp. Idaho Grape]